MEATAGYEWATYFGLVKGAPVLVSDCILGERSYEVSLT